MVVPPMSWSMARSRPLGGGMRVVRQVEMLRRHVVLAWPRKGIGNLLVHLLSGNMA